MLAKMPEPRKPIRTASTVLSALGIVAVLHEFGVKYAEQKGWYDNLPDRTEAAMNWLVSLSEPLWFKIGLAFVAGTTVGLWLDAALRRREARPLPGPGNVPNVIRADSTVSTQVDRAQPASVTREFVPRALSHHDIAGVFRDRTAVEGDIAFSIYVGKWMKVAGTVNNVTNLLTAGVMLHLEHPADRAGLSAVFHGKWAKKVMMLRRGSPVTIVGQVEHGGSANVRLVNCEIEETGSGDTINPV